LDYFTPDGDQKKPLFHSTITLINTKSAQINSNRYCSGIEMKTKEKRNANVGQTKE